MNTTNIPLIRCVDLVVACEKIKLATDQRFSCYDREEESVNLDYFYQMHMTES